MKQATSGVISIRTGDKRQETETFGNEYRFQSYFCQVNSKQAIPKFFSVITQALVHIELINLLTYHVQCREHQDSPSEILHLHKYEDQEGSLEMSKS